MSVITDVVIIGAGLLGCSTALSLASRGVQRVVVLEKDTIGSGSSGKSSAILRCHYTHPQLAAMALKALRIYQNFNEAIGGECGYTRTGYIVLVGPENAEVLMQNVLIHQSLGIPVQPLQPDDVQRLVPQLNVHDVMGACIEWEAGYADPSLTNLALAARARQLGVEIRQRSPVVDIVVQKGRVAGVWTPDEFFSVPVVIDCAGPWADRVARLAGLQVPVEAHREQIVIVERPPSFDGSHPIISDLIKLQYVRPDLGRLTLLGNSDHSHYQVVDPDHYDTAPDAEAVEVAIEKAVHRFPCFGECAIRRGYCGCYEVTPDYQPIMDQVPGIEGFYVNAGFSGHGFKLAPVAGEMMAEFVLEGASRDFDIRLFRLTRFAEGRPVRGPHPYSRGQALR